MVNIPSPPNSIKIIIISLPKKVKFWVISTTTNPVTQTALVAVNKAFIKEIPFTVDFGIINNAVPIIDNITKLIIKIKYGLSINLFKLRRKNIDLINR